MHKCDILYYNMHTLTNTCIYYLFSVYRDFIEISDLTYRKLEIGKVVTQPVKIIRTLDPFKPKI